jgi:hypothetical protein
LWYKGFIYRAFQVTKQGGVEFIYIARDLLPLIQVHIEQTTSQATIESSSSTFDLNSVSVPPIILNNANRLRENIFRLLVFLQTTSTHPQPDGSLTMETEQKLSRCLLTPRSSIDEVRFLFFLAKKNNLLEFTSGSPKPNRQTARHWLEADEAEQIRQLRNSWRTTYDWNDLWHIPGIFPQPTGWENDPLLARQKILGYLANLPADWFSIDEFVAKIKQIEPDFQRPDGDYEQWYIQDNQGNFLMGFTDWERVDGALIRYLLTCVLPWLSVVDSGISHQPTTFRITTSGRIFLESVAQSSDCSPTQSEDCATSLEILPFQVNPDFQVIVPAMVNLFDRFQLARFAVLHQYELDRICYHLTPMSIVGALQNGITIKHILTFLKRASQDQLPPTVIEGLENWAGRWGTVRLQPVVLLHLESEHLVHELRQYPDLEQPLENMLDSKTIAISANDAPFVKRLLTELGYLG